MTNQDSLLPPPVERPPASPSSSTSQSSSSESICLHMSMPQHQTSQSILAPSPDEESDSDEDVAKPSVLKTVIKDLRQKTEELGPLHEKVAELWSSLGLIRLHMQRNVSAAVKCHEQALRIHLLSRSVNPLQVAVVSLDLGSCYERQNEPDRALELYEGAYEQLRASDVQSPQYVLQSLCRSIARLKRR